MKENEDGMGTGKKGGNGERRQVLYPFSWDSFFFVCVCVCCCNIMKEKREPFDVRFHHPTSSHSSYITYRGYRTMKHNLFWSLIQPKRGISTSIFFFSSYFVFGVTQKKKRKKTFFIF